MKDNVDRFIWPYKSTIGIANWPAMDESYYWCKENLKEGSWCYDLDHIDDWVIHFYFRYEEEYTRFVLTWG